MTEPEQWAMELWTEARRRHDVAKRSPGFYNQDAEMIAALTIQRAFEEQTRELREAVGELLSAQDAIDNWKGGYSKGFTQALVRRQVAYLATSRALATRQPTPTEGSSHDQ